MTDLLLIRHGRPVSGRFDPPLDEVGRAQAEALGRLLAREDLTAVVCSDLVRAEETARFVAEPHGLSPEPMAGLREWGLPAASMEYVALELLGPESAVGRALEEGRFMDFIPERVDVPTFREVVRATFDDIVATHAGGRVAVVCHGGIINAYLASLVGIPDVFWFNAEYTSVSRVRQRPGGRVVIESVNEAHHLLVDAG